MSKLALVALAIFLFLQGALLLFPGLTFAYHHMVLGSLALIAGVLILLQLPPR